MDDLTITKLCAEAMGLVCSGEAILCDARLYDPLHDDAQAMALVKRWALEITALPQGRPAPRSADQIEMWQVGGDIKEIPNRPSIVAFDANLNRAICECVAKMQEAKHG